MAFDFKKEYKGLYMPKNKPEIVNVSKANYIAVRGKGDPNEEGGAYQQAISVLYAVAYALKMSYKTDYKIEGFFEYVVPPLEGLWQVDGLDFDGMNVTDKDKFKWISMIRQPEFVTAEVFEQAKLVLKKKKPALDLSKARLMKMTEGLCVQIMHKGSYDDEPASIEQMKRFLDENGYIEDFSEGRFHHEIYLSDPRKCSTDKLKTVIRHPIKKK